jgi:pilus assembly protein CpaE
MVSAIERARERSNRQQRNVRAVVASQPPAPVVDTGANVIVVVSPKGGSGKTMLSTNLAYGLAQRHPGTVALVDLDVQFGDVGTALRLNAQYSIAEAVHNPTDPIHVKSYLTPHDAGFWVLGAPANPIDADDVKPEAVKLVLETLRLEFDWLVIDTGAGVDDHTLTALELASQVILVATTDVAAIHGVRKLVDVLDQLNFPAERQVVVLNRANARVGLSVEDIERTVGRRVEGRIPSARVVPTSMNLGSAILEDNARSNVGRAINDLIDDLDPGDAGGDGASRWSLFGAGRS